MTALKAQSYTLLSWITYFAGTYYFPIKSTILENWKRNLSTLFMMFKLIIAIPKYLTWREDVEHHQVSSNKMKRLGDTAAILLFEYSDKFVWYSEISTTLRDKIRMCISLSYSPSLTPTNLPMMEHGFWTEWDCPGDKSFLPLSTPT